MLQCYLCYKYFFTDEDWEMNHCGGAFENVCPKCQDKLNKQLKEIDEEE